MRAMRMLVMFDLPTGSAAERKTYTKFRKFLIDDGYHMEQFSVYSRVLLSRDSAESHEARLRQNLPPTGHVTLLMLTEKQYAARKVLVSTTAARKAPSAPDDAQLTLVF